MQQAHLDRMKRRHGRRGLVAGLMLALALAGCAATGARIRPAPVLVPEDLAADRPYKWAVLSPQELASLLATPLPEASELETGLTDLQMLERATGRQVLWVPPLPPVLREAQSKGRPYAQFRREWGPDRPAPTVGALLRSIIAAETAGGTPIIRMIGWYPKPGESPWRTRGLAWAQAQAQVAGLPELMDAAIVTRKHIVIVALPRE